MRRCPVNADARAGRYQPAGKRLLLLPLLAVLAQALVLANPLQANTRAAPSTVLGSLSPHVIGVP